MLHSQPHPDPSRGSMASSSVKLNQNQCNLDGTVMENKPPRPPSPVLGAKSLRYRVLKLFNEHQQIYEDNETAMLNVEKSPEDDDVAQVAEQWSDEQFYQTLDENERLAYGELIILGYNGSLPQGENDRRRSKYELVQRDSPNGIRKSKHYSVTEAKSSEAIRDKQQHSISFTLNRSQAIIVEYQHDEETDLFQVTFLTFISILLIF